MSNYIILDLKSEIKKHKLSDEQIAAFAKLIELMRKYPDLTDTELESIAELGSIINVEEIGKLLLGSLSFSFEPAISTLKSVQTHLRKENNKIKNLLDQRYKAAGKILSCHCLIEYLVLKHSGKSKQELKDKGNQKQIHFSLLLKEVTFLKKVKHLKIALLNLNEIRNKIAHEFILDTTILKTESIDKFLQTRTTNKVLNYDLVDKIEAFTIIVLKIFLIYRPEVMNKFVSLQDYYEETSVGIKRKSKK